MGRFAVGSSEAGAGSGEREAGFSPLSIIYPNAKYFSRKACSLAPKTII